MIEFDEIVSLGYNCEVSFRIEDFCGRINAMPFSWSFVTNRNKFLDALRNTEQIFDGEAVLCDDRMIMCKHFELKYHPRYSILPRIGTYTEEQYQEALIEVRNRVMHLAKKFVELCSSNKKTLFVIKVEDRGNDDNTHYIQAICDTISEIYVSGNYALAIAIQKKAVTAEIMALESEKVRIFSLKRFAPKKYTNILGDIKGWYKLFYSMTGSKAPQYFRRIIKRRYEWAISVIKRRLHI